MMPSHLTEKPSLEVDRPLVKVYPDLSQPGTCRLKRIYDIYGNITAVTRKNKQAVALS